MKFKFSGRTKENAMKNAIAVSLLFASSTLFAQEITVKAIAFTSLPYYNTTVYNVQPATANSYCTLTGSDALATSYCTTTYQPAYANTLTTRVVYNYDLVEGSGYRYSLLCTASWRWSKCRPMISGEFFKAKVTGSDMEIEAVNGKGKPTHIKYHILAVAPVIRQINPGSDPEHRLVTYH